MSDQPPFLLPPGYQRNPFRYLAFDVTNRTYLGKLPYQGVTFGVPQLNQPGPFAGALPIADPRVRLLNWQACTYTGRVAVIVDLLGVIVWGGILWTNSYQDSDATKSLKVGGTSFGSYLQQRVQAADYTNTWASGGDPMLIAEQVIGDALTLSNIMGGVTIVLHPAAGESGPLISPSYPSSSLQTIDSMVSIMAQMGYGTGFDYSFDVAYSSPGVPQVTLNIWFPRQGRTADQTNLVILQRNVIDFTYPVDSTQQADNIWETGSGTGGIQPAEATTSLADYPRLDRTFSRSQVNDEGTLGNIAAGDLWLYAWPVITPTVTLPMALPDSQGNIDPRKWSLGGFYLGDDVTWKIDPIAGVQQGYGRSPRFPDGMDYEWRISGWTAKVADQQGQMSSITLNLQMPPGEGVPLQPPL